MTARRTTSPLVLGHPLWGAAGFGVGPHANTVIGSRNGPALVIEMARPSATHCVVVTAIVVRYHVGIRHYTATVPQGEVGLRQAGSPARRLLNAVRRR